MEKIEATIKVAPTIITDLVNPTYKGDTGPAGPMGPAGPQGIQGIQGPVGPQGPAGDTATIDNHTLIKNTSNQLQVNVVDNTATDKTLPISLAGVESIVGNIDALLELI